MCHVLQMCIHGAFLLCISVSRCGRRCRDVQTGMHLFFCGVFHNSKGKYHSMKPLFLLSLLLLSLTLFSAEIIGKVVGVSDGDTITVLDDMDKGRFRIRLDKIDAPEQKQCFGINAKNHLVSLIFGKQVKVIYRKKDRYKRILGIVYLQEKEINLQMVKDGFAWHYSYFDNTKSYIEAEQKAKQNKSGLWIQENPVTPYEFRKRRK